MTSAFMDAIEANYAVNKRLLEIMREENEKLMLMPDKPLYLADLPLQLQEAFLAKYRECFPEMCRLYSEEQIREGFGSEDLRIFMQESTAEESAYVGQVAASSPWWAVGSKSKVFLGKLDMVEMFLGAAAERGWVPADPETNLEGNFSIPIGPNDSLSLARILRARLKPGDDSRVRRLIEAVIALLMEGPVTFTPGPGPGNDDLFFSKPARPPHLDVVK